MEDECSIKVKFAGALVMYASVEELGLSIKCGSSLRNLLNQLITQNPRLRRRLFNNDELLPGIYVAVNDTDIRLLSGLETKLKNGDTVLFLSYIHGG